MTEQNTVGTIFAKVARIQAEVGAIPKDGVGPSAKGSFKYVRAEDILDKIHALLVQENVIVIPSLEYTKHNVEMVNNRQYVSVALTARYTYVSVEDGSSITVTAVGEGSDIGSDTATRKAATQALKISHLHTFTIPNSEFDDEGYEPASKAAAPAANTKAAQVISKASKSAVTPEVSELQGTVRKFVDSGVGADVVKTIGERVTKELGKPSYDKNDVDILRGIVSALNAGEVA